MKEVLLVEDSDQDALLITSMLPKPDFNVHHCSDFFQALEVIEKQDFDLIILDYLMPFMNGLKGLKQLRGTEAYRYKPILLLTSASSLGTVLQARELGATDFIVKPPSKEMLLQRIEKAMEAK